jgi:ABC-type multidrug transport system fused ATPase/permease subunit
MRHNRLTPAGVLIGNLRGHRRDAAALAGWSLVQALPALASGWTVAEAAGQFLAGRTVAGLAWLGVLAAAALAGAVATRQTFISLGAVVEPLRDDLVELVVTGALAGTAGSGSSPADGGAPDAATSRWIARITHQAEIVRDGWAGVLSVACTFAFTVGSTVVGLVTIVPATLLYVLPPLAASVIALRLLLPPYAARQRDAVIAEEAVADSAARAISGLRDVTACGGEDEVLAGLDDLIAGQAAATRSAAWVGAIRLLCVAAGGLLPLVLVLGAAPALLRGGVSPAHIIGAVTYLAGSLRATLNTLSQGMGGSLVRLTVSLERILSEARAADSMPDDGRRRPLPAGTRVPGHLQLRRVTFGYGTQAEPVIRDLSLDIPAGEHLAVVGPSGIGKSSLAGLLAGTLRPDYGAVLVDGTPVAARDPRWRVLIPQEAYVFTGTLAANLRYYRAASVPELNAAAAAVGLAALVARLGGYEAQVDPFALSAGERQLIALTRAYLSAASVVILDEATCHLDPAAEEQAEEAFARRGGTLIVIAHRITSALRARRILVLDGTRAQDGDHIRLLGDSAMYRDLVGYWINTG